MLPPLNIDYYGQVHCAKACENLCISGTYFARGQYRGVPTRYAGELPLFPNSHDSEGRHQVKLPFGQWSLQDVPRRGVLLWKIKLRMRYQPCCNVKRHDLF